MASGLDNLFTTYGNEYGALGAMQTGRSRGLKDMTSQLTNAQTQAETSRYTGETPSFLRNSEAAATSAELANAGPQAEVNAGVPEAKAGQSLAEAKQKAQQAQAEFDAWPAKQKLQLMDQMAAQTEKFNQLGMQLLQFSGSTGEAIQRMAETYPEITKDPQFKSWVQQYGNMPLDQARNAFKMQMQKYASGISTTREKFQTEALLQDQKGQQESEHIAQRGQYGIAEAQTRAAGGEDKENSTGAIRRLATIIASPNSSEQQKAAAEYELKAHLKYGQQLEASKLDPIFDSSKTKELPPRPGAAAEKPDIKGMVEAAGGKYDPNKFDYQINPATGKVQSKPKGK